MKIKDIKEAIRKDYDLEKNSHMMIGEFKSGYLCGLAQALVIIDKMEMEKKNG